MIGLSIESDGVATSLVASALFFVSGWFASRAVRVLRLRRPARKVWQLPNDSEISIVTATAPLVNQSEYTYAMYPAECLAASEIAIFLSHTFSGVFPKITPSATFHPNNELEGNLVLIGGPNHNEITARFLNKLDPPFHFEGSDLLLSSGERFSPVVIDGQIVEDVGVAFVAANPYNAQSRVVLLIGSRTYGCLAAARALIDDRVRRAAKLRASDGSILLVVRTDIVGHFATGIEVVYPTRADLPGLAAKRRSPPAA